MRHPVSCERTDHANYNEWIRCVQRRKAHRIARENAKPIREIPSGVRQSSGVQLLLGENGFEGSARPKS